jgi:uncharacterized protein YqgC (DUF456 family)
MLYLAGGIVVLFSLLGVGLTLLTLPGAWIAIIASALCDWWQPGLLSLWTIVAAAGVALLAELIEFFASAYGASRAGGSKRGALGAIIGSFVGAILGAPFGLLIGAIVGGAIGAGVGAILAERGWVGKNWKESANIGAGAAVGRLGATVVKVALSGVVALILIVGAINP